MTPPDELKEQVFPFLKEYREMVAANLIDDLATKKFVELVNEMSIVLLQDAVENSILEGWRENEAYGHPIFHSNVFTDFKNSLLSVMTESKKSFDHVSLKHLVPTLSDALRFVGETVLV